MRKRILILCMALAILSMSACAMPQVPPEDDAIPHRMVTQIDVSSFPDDSTMAHSYHNSETLTTLVRIIQNMETSEVPEKEPRLDGEKAYFSITATYANGEKDSYHVLDKQFMQHRDGQWCLVDSAKVDELCQFIQGTPSN